MSDTGHEVKNVSVKGHLLKRPCYALSADATIAEMRATAVRAMDEMLTFRWTPETDFSYEKSVNSKMKPFPFISGKAYGGLPYTAAALGIFHALEHYDYETGVISDTAEIKDINMEFGNSCSASANWGIVSVCPSVSAVSTSDITPSYGYAPVNNFPFPDVRKLSRTGESTKKIIENNGTETMLEALAASLPGDILVTIGSDKAGNHVQMVAEAPNVVRKEDGTIDPEQSTIRISDQWAKEVEKETEDGIVSVRGRVHKEFSFAYQMERHFIPMRPVDFLEGSRYVKAEARFNYDVKNLPDLKMAWIVNNYRVVKTECLVLNENGEVCFRKSHVTNRWEYPEKQDKNMPGILVCPTDEELSAALTPGLYTVEVRSLVSTGEIVSAGKFPLDFSS